MRKPEVFEKKLQNLAELPK